MPIKMSNYLSREMKMVKHFFWAALVLSNLNYSMAAEKSVGPESLNYETGTLFECGGWLRPMPGTPDGRHLIGIHEKSVTLSPVQDQAEQADGDAAANGDQSAEIRLKVDLQIFVRDSIHPNEKISFYQGSLIPTQDLVRKVQQVAKDCINGSSTKSEMIELSSGQLIKACPLVHQRGESEMEYLWVGDVPNYIVKMVYANFRYRSFEECRINPESLKRSQQNSERRLQLFEGLDSDN